jgi:hypothetical protein
MSVNYVLFPFNIHRCVCSRPKLAIGEPNSHQVTVDSELSAFTHRSIVDLPSVTVISRYAHEPWGKGADVVGGGTIEDGDKAPKVAVAGAI